MRLQPLNRFGRWGVFQQPAKAFVAYAAAGKESRQDVAHGVAPGGHAHLCSSREAVQTPQIGAQAAQIHDSEALLITLVLA